MSRKQKQNLPKKPTTQALVNTAYRQGEADGKALVLQAIEYERELGQPRRSALVRIMALLSELKGIARAGIDAGLRGDYYRAEIKRLTGDIGRAVVDYRNAWPPMDEYKATDFLSMITAVLDAAPLALKGDRQAFYATFEQFNILQAGDDELADLDRGGHPGGKNANTLRLRNMAQQARAELQQGQRGPVTYQQIANRLIRDLQTIERRTPGEDRLLHKLKSSDRPDRMIQNALDS